MWMLQEVFKKRKFSIFAITFVFIICCAVFVHADSTNCTSDEDCRYHKICKHNFCVCPDGWQGSKCQHCTGKIRLTETAGFIHDGFGKYSDKMKCNWLIDSRKTVLSAIGLNDSTDTLTYNEKPSKIRLHLEEFVTECGWDYLYIYDGDSVESPLLAAYSGLMYNRNHAIRKVPEIVAESGLALIHFFSDDTGNMTGFNISYKIDGCPTSNSAFDCSGHGECAKGSCNCSSTYSGEACNIDICLNDCTHWGICDSKPHKSCMCPNHAGGINCSQPIALGSWSTVSLVDSTPPPSKASHGAVVGNDKLYIIGGENYDRGEFLNMYDFNGHFWDTIKVEGNNFPDPRYGASIVMKGKNLFMYGGMIRKKGITNELWTFDIDAKIWQNITMKIEFCTEIRSTMCGPLSSVGHTATLVPRIRANYTSQRMVIIFGYSPKYGYLNTVQEYNFETTEWQVIETSGYIVKGGYGHSASYDEFSKKIYVYGGAMFESENTQILSSKLYAYDPDTRIWSLLESAPSGRFLHTGNFLSAGLMMVFGGSTQKNDEKCYSKDFMFYDVLCDSWHIQDIPKYFTPDLSRFGHSAVIFEESVYIFGGFDGQLLSDLLKFTPGNCDLFRNKKECINTRPGVKCIWDIKNRTCISLKKENEISIVNEDYILCPKKEAITIMQDVDRCSEMTNCQSCVSNTFGCTYCGNGICSKNSCSYIKSLEQCSEIEPELSSACEHLHSCHLCSSNPSCHWVSDLHQCKPLEITNDIKDVQCSPPCATLLTCENCTESSCIWCQNEERCIDRNAYRISYPYGQCRDWTTFSDKCRPQGFQCGFYKFCDQCISDPACGWCDDESGTGLGKCISGADHGPQMEKECQSSLWHFTDCPDCQCNGHSVCSDKFNCNKPCSNFTKGRNCEKCRSGYWGDPINGGICQKCECNGEASNCDMNTGKCFCNKKGFIGDHCDQCDSQNHYYGDPSKGICYYSLTIDYQFTFNLSKESDRHYNQIHFRNSPPKSDIDVDFSIICSNPAKFNITARTANSSEEIVLSGMDCYTLQKHNFPRSKYIFGIENDEFLTTFDVFVYDFKPPLWIRIAFSQSPKLNLSKFLISLAAATGVSVLPLVYAYF